MSEEQSKQAVCDEEHGAARCQRAPGHSGLHAGMQRWQEPGGPVVWGSVVEWDTLARSEAAGGDIVRDVEAVADFIGGQNWEANTLRRAAKEITRLRAEVARLTPLVPATTTGYPELHHYGCPTCGRGYCAWTGQDTACPWCAASLRQQLAAAEQNVTFLEGEVRTAWGQVDRQAKAKVEARQQLAAIAEREAAVCPEDVGFDEYIRALEKQLAAAREDGERIIRALDGIGIVLNEDDPECREWLVVAQPDPIICDTLAEALQKALALCDDAARSEPSGEVSDA